jgi:hypothetical protein
MKTRHTIYAENERKLFEKRLLRGILGTKCEEETGG